MTSVHGWGRYPRRDGQVVRPASASECRRAVLAGPLIARGLGRSYGDSSLAQQMLSMDRLDHLLDFDAKTGVLSCEAGVSLDAILRLSVPRGWFLAVAPGTRFVSVGGAIASDVHGKNHHLDGTFGPHVRELQLMLGDGSVVTASPDENGDLFHATCGGMGLTGVILAATLQLRRIVSSDIMETTIKAAGLDCLLEAFEANAASAYSVAWIDCAARGARLGRSLLMLGEHALEGPLRPQVRGSARVPFDLPAALLNRSTARAFNALYYRCVRQDGGTRRLPFERFFHPLDAIADWNRLYGAPGLLQYQFVLPAAAGAGPLREVLARIADAGLGSFLAVLKKLGPANRNLLSFPLEGYTLALDFKREPAAFDLLDALDAMVLHHGGRIYLAKDARMSATAFRRGYPRWEEFESVRLRWHAHGRFASDQSKRLGLV